MADLNKLLVKVPANLCDAFRTKYLTGDGSTPRDTSYDRKIVFLEDNKDIFSQGKIYGTSHAEFEELKNKIEDKSVTLTFGVNSFSNISEEGSTGSDAATHYDAVYKAYTNNGIVKIALNNGNSAILSNIEFTDSINAMGDSRYTIKGILCPSSTTEGAGSNKSYNITFKYDTGDPYYITGYYVSCKEITDTLYNKKVGGTEIQGDSAGTFTETIDATNATLKTVLQQLLTNDLLLNDNRCVDINLPGSTFEFNVTGTEAETYFNKVKNAYDNGSNIRVNVVGGKKSAIISNLEKTDSFLDLLVPEPSDPEVYVGILCPYKVVDSVDNQSYTITFYKDTNSNSYHAKCVAIDAFGSAAYEDKSYFDKAGAATAAQNNSYAYAYAKFEESKVYAEDKMMFVLGRADAEETSNTVIGTRKYANSLANTAYSNAKNYTDSVLPTVSAGNNINVETTTDSNGKVNYKVSTTATVFNYKGNKTTKAELENVQDKVSGDVWSVGAADAPGSSLYAWDGDEWINIGPADGVVGINNTPSHGIGLTLNNGIVGISVTPGSVGTSENFVTGEAVYYYINSLSDSKTSTDGSYVNVTVSTKGGNVSSVSISESDNLKTAVDKANSALQSVNVLGKTLDKTTNAITVDEAKTYLGLGSAAYKDETYFDKAGAATAVENKLPGVTNGTGIEVSSSSDANGKVTYTLSTTSEIIRYKGNVDKVNELGNGTEGDVYSVNNSLLYRYIGSGLWYKIAGKIQSVTTTPTDGIALTFDDTSGALGISVTTGKVSSSKFGDGDKLVKGYDVYEALCAYTIKDVIVNAEDSTYITVAKNKYSDSSYSYCEISLNEAAIYSYVLDNIWEEFSLA